MKTVTILVNSRKMTKIRKDVLFSKITKSLKILSFNKLCEFDNKNLCIINI